MNDFVCVYTGRADECMECGGFNQTGDRFCSHECAGSYADRAAVQEAEVQARRDREDAFGRECDRLRALGYGDVEIDALLIGMPT